MFLRIDEDPIFSNIVSKPCIMEKVTLRALKSGIQLQLQVELNKSLCTMKKKKKKKKKKKRPPG